MTTPKPPAEAAEGTRPAGQAEVAGREASEVCGRRYLFEGDAAHAYLCGLPKCHGSPCGQESDERAPPASYELIESLRSELSTLRQQLEAERHGAWAAGHRAGWKDRFGSDCAFDQGYDPDEPTPNPYPPPPAEAPALPVGKETE